MKASYGLVRDVFPLWFSEAPPSKLLCHEDRFDEPFSRKYQE